MSGARVSGGVGGVGGGGGRGGRVGGGGDWGKEGVGGGRHNSASSVGHVTAIECSFLWFARSDAQQSARLRTRVACLTKSIPLSLALRSVNSQK